MTAPNTSIPTDVLLSGLPHFAADMGAAMQHIAMHRGEVYLNGDGGDLGGGLSATLVVRHAANHLAVLQVARAIDRPVTDLLDVGCGTGSAAATLASWLGAHLHLCDSDAAALAVAGNAFKHESAVTDLFEAPSADIVTSMDVVEHVEHADQDAFVAELAGRVRPGGLLALATPDESSYPGGRSGYLPHVGCLSPAELERLLLRVTGRPATVLRLAGGPFRTHPLRQSWERVANAAWGVLSSEAPGVATAVARLGTRSAPSAEAVDSCAQEPVVAVLPERTSGTGLLGFVQL